MADNDFRALGKVANLSPMTEGQLAAVEGGQSCSGLLAIGNTCLNVATPTVIGLNASLLGLFGATNQWVKQVTTQSIY
jgi:hypothetical protein